MKKRIIEWLPHVKLFEAYGSTEAGCVTVLSPEDQLRKEGAIGKPTIGTYDIKLLDDEGKEVPVGEVGELYSRGPMMFDGYHKLPEKTKNSFRVIDGHYYFSAGDMAKMDEDGYFYLVDRKDNLMITGGEHVYPSEVEFVIAQHPRVFDVGVVGLPDEKWGEAVTAVVIPKEGETPTEEEIIEWCMGKMAGFKKPKRVIFIKPEDMPRTTTGKIFHRKLGRSLLRRWD